MDVHERPKQCCVCKAEGAALRCSCRRFPFIYCNRECQKRGWQNHKDGCTAYKIKKFEQQRDREGRDSFTLAQPCMLIGGLFHEQDRAGEAEEWFLEASRIFHMYAEALGPSQGDALIAGVSGALGEVYQSQGRWEEALKLHKEALVVFQRQGHEDPQAMCLNDIGEDLRKLGRYEEAIKNYKKSLKIYRRLYGDTCEQVLIPLGNMASVLDEQGNGLMGLQVKEEVLAIQRAMPRCDQRHLAISLLNIGMSRILIGLLDEAKSALDEGLGIVRRIQPERNELEANFLMQLGNLHRARGEYEEALTMQKKARTMFRKTIGPGSMEVGKTCEYSAEVLRLQGENDKALEMFERALAIKRALGTRQVFKTLDGMAKVKEAMGDLGGAAENLREAISVAPELLTPELSSRLRSVEEKMRG